MNLMDIKGVGPKTMILLNKLGIYETDDIIEYYPFRYEVLKRSDINTLNQDDKIIIDGIVEKVPTVYYIKKNFDKMQFNINTGSNILKVIIFNRGFLKNNLVIGKTITVIGKYDLKNNTVIASDIRLKGISKNLEIDPIYHVTSGLTSRNLNTYMKEIIPKLTDINDYIPEEYIKKYNFISKIDAINKIHFPNNLNDIDISLKRLIYEELFIFMMRINNLKFQNKNSIGIKRDIDINKVNDFINKIPFILTDDQLKSVDDIYNDLTGPNRMNRLLQGDVGSGKTIVSFISLYINYLSGYQGALMAPTDVLANQHYNNILKLFDKNIKICLLTGNLKLKDKTEIQEKIKEGYYDIIIGTHALITDKVEYKNLGLVITDEQHRFGVNQRSTLNNKGINPDILYMSATPIPRTYALTLYGDMEISTIKTVPKNRKEIKTIIKSNKDIKEVLSIMYKELELNHQIYVVVPLIEENEELDLENIYKVHDNMSKAFAHKYNLGIMHGKLKPKEKDKIMEDFINNKIQILISTTVIEVGIDVENATTIVIMDAELFGLSQLHQLRGRVGRNEYDSTCILVSDSNTKRLEILTKTTDGFKISEEDFKLRGSGDLFGFKQSGDMNFKLANIKENYDVLIQTKDDSLEYLNKYKSNELIKKIININNID